MALTDKQLEKFNSIDTSKIDDFDSIDAYCADIPDDLETNLKNIEKYFND